MAQRHPDKLPSDAHECLQKAVDFAWGCQQPDGHWVAPVSADATFTAQYVMFKCQIPGLSLDEDGPAIKQWLLSDQTHDGSWVLAPGLPGNVSTTVEAYLALRLLGTPASHPAMLRARDFVLSEGGVARVRFFTRFFLATFGLFPWAAVPQMPAELILLPTWFFLNIYVLSSWARSTLIPVLVARHHEPVYALPNGRSPYNDFLDELWCDPDDKHVPIGPPLWELVWGPKQDLVAFVFTLLDKILAMLGGLRWWPLRQFALDKCIEWLVEHQEESGDWAGFFPPIHGSVWALILQGFPLHSKEVRLGLEALERLAVNDKSGKWLQSTISPQWDTALMLNALCDAGFREDPRMVKAAAWLRDMQLIVPQGDWRIYAKTQQAGGWSFQYYNTFYPDVDDAAVVVMGLVKQDPGCIHSDCILNALEWILGMQNRDGGWGAFDINNDSRWLHKIPFSDMDSLVDPATADVTGRILECFGMLLAHRECSRLCLRMRRRLEHAAERAIVLLQKEQETSGAAAGSWWGRWGSNYNYGTGNVLRGLVWFANSSPVARDCAERAVLWFEGCQNQDGGWGETLLSYVDPGLAGCGKSNAAQTAWALDCLLRFRPSTDLAIQRGTQWLTANQTEQAENGQGARWRCDDIYVGTGFPDVLYLGYPFYHLHFPISALARYLNAPNPLTHPVASNGLQINPKVASDMDCPSVLMMAMGSRGDLVVFLNVAKILKGWRIRIATHPCHRAMVEGYGFEYYNVGGSPDEFSNTLGNAHGVLQSVMKGKLSKLRGSLCQTYAMFWRASFDNDRAFISERRAKASRRPFIADVIVAGAATSVHVHAAEKLQIPLVIVSPQPALPTSEFPHPLTMSKPTLNSSAWWNMVSYFCLDLAIWAAFGRFINRLRVQEYGMRPWRWLWATRYLHSAGIPNVCMWSSNILATPKDWEGHIIAGYSWSADEANFEPHETLQQFLNTRKPVLAVSMGSATVRDPVQLLRTLSIVSERLAIRSVVCRSWPATVEMGLQRSSALYVTDYVPHSWLLPRVHGFMHHGGAGHTAAGMRAGTPMLITPHFLDQYFWAAQVAERSLGPPALDHRQVNATRLQASLDQLLSGKYKTACAWMAKQLCTEGDGAQIAAEVIVHQVCSPTMKVPCSVMPSVVAHWRHKDTGLALSSAVVSCLISHEFLGQRDVELLPRINWTSRLQEPNQSSKSVLSFGTILGWMALLISMLHFMIGGPRGDVSFEAENMHAKALHDPIRQARMKQGIYDIQAIKQQSGHEEWSKYEEDIIHRWRTLAATAFHAYFGRKEVMEDQALDIIAAAKVPSRPRRDSKLE